MGAGKADNPMLSRPVSGITYRSSSPSTLREKNVPGSDIRTAGCGIVWRQHAARERAARPYASDHAGGVAVRGIRCRPRYGAVGSCLRLPQSRADGVAIAPRMGVARRCDRLWRNLWSHLVDVGSVAHGLIDGILASEPRINAHGWARMVRFSREFRRADRVRHGGNCRGKCRALRWARRIGRSIDWRAARERSLSLLGDRHQSAPQGFSQRPDPDRRAEGRRRRRGQPLPRAELGVRHASPWIDRGGRSRWIPWLRTEPRSIRPGAQKPGNSQDERLFWPRSIFWRHSGGTVFWRRSHAPALYRRGALGARSVVASQRKTRPRACPRTRRAHALSPP